MRLSLVAISPPTAPNSRKSLRDNSLEFSILSEARSEVPNAFGIRFALLEYLVELYREFENDLPAFNDDPSWVLPMPARYVIGTDGIIAYSEVNPDYTQRPDPSELPPCSGSPESRPGAYRYRPGRGWWYHSAGAPAPAGRRSRGPWAPRKRFGWVVRCSSEFSIRTTTGHIRSANSTKTGCS
ncbi:MAG: redoxin domain-containing protein [Xanthobacteraceae bacterium]|nr:redoxin domain-containing protein [Xanthobacteraceae bacterium]